MCSCEGGNHSQISCWAHMVISVFGYACKCLIQHREGVTVYWGNKRKDIAGDIFPPSPLPLLLWAVSLLHAILQEEYLELRFSIPWGIISESPSAAFWAAPVMCQQTKMLWSSCSCAQLHPSPSQKLRQKLISLLLPHIVSSHPCEWQSLGYVHYAKLHLCSRLLFGEGLANAVSLWSRNFHTGSLIPHEAATNDNSSISLSLVNGCLDI